MLGGNYDEDGNTRTASVNMTDVVDDRFDSVQTKYKQQKSPPPTDRFGGSRQS